MRNTITLILCMFAAMVSAHSTVQRAVPDSIKVQFQKSLELQQQGKLDEAEEIGLEALEQLVELFDDEQVTDTLFLADCYMQMGELFREMDFYEESEDCLQVAVVIMGNMNNPNVTNALEHLFEVTRLRDNQQESIPSFTRPLPQATFLKNRKPLDRYGLAYILAYSYINDDYAEAIRYFQIAIDVAKTLSYDAYDAYIAECTTRIADCYVNLGETNIAKHYYKEATIHYDYIEKKGQLTPSGYLNYGYNAYKAEKYNLSGQMTVAGLSKIISTNVDNLYSDEETSGILLSNLAELLYEYGFSDLSELCLIWQKKIYPSHSYQFDDFHFTPNDSTFNWVADACRVIAQINASVASEDHTMGLIVKSLTMQNYKEKDDVIKWTWSSLKDKWNAPPYPAIPFRPTEYSAPMADSLMYIYNVGAGQFLNAGNGWGTQSSVDNKGVTFKINSSLKI